MPRKWHKRKTAIAGKARGKEWEALKVHIGGLYPEDARARTQE